MPLKCFSGELELFAFQFNNENWELLREQNRKSKNLRMPCCSSGVVLKQSKLMTRFFAHARKGPCTTQPETPEHLLAKAEIAKAIEAAGWIATTECSGTSPSGNCWTTDVMARKEELQVAFEVQWSPQSDTETTQRQERYRESSVRGLWLFRQKDFISSKEIPAFKLSFNAEKDSFSVVVCAGHYSMRIRIVLAGKSHFKLAC